jgi:hypothetical protein
MKPIMFTGRVINGPLYGSTLTHVEPRYNIIAAPPGRPWSEYTNPAAFLPQVMTYKHDPHPYQDERGVERGYWVLDKGEND